MATQTKDYATLGVKKSASAEDIRKASANPWRKYHPDVNPGDKTAEREVQGAVRGRRCSERSQEAEDLRPTWVSISDNIDPATADAYARAGGGAGGPSGGFPGGRPTGAGGQGGNFDFGGFDFTDLFEGGGGGVTGGNPPAPEAGASRTSSPACSGDVAARRTKGPNRGQIWNIRSMSPSGPRSGAAS